MQRKQAALDAEEDEQWREIRACLPAVTGHHAGETRTYVDRVQRWWGELDPRGAGEAGL